VSGELLVPGGYAAENGGADFVQHRDYRAEESSAYLAG